MVEKKEGTEKKNRQTKDQKSPTTQPFFVTTNIVPLPPPPPPPPAAPPLLSLMLFSFWSPFFTNDPKNILSPHLLFTPTTTTFIKLILPLLPPVRTLSFPFIKNSPSN